MCAYHTVLCYEALPLAVKEGSYGLMVMRTVKCYVGVAWAAVCIRLCRNHPNARRDVLGGRTR